MMKNFTTTLVTLGSLMVSLIAYGASGTADETYIAFSPASVATWSVKCKVVLALPDAAGKPENVAFDSTIDAWPRGHVPGARDEVVLFKAPSQAWFYCSSSGNYCNAAFAMSGDRYRILGDFLLGSGFPKLSNGSFTPEQKAAALLLNFG